MILALQAPSLCGWGLFSKSGSPKDINGSALTVAMESVGTAFGCMSQKHHRGIPLWLSLASAGPPYHWDHNLLKDLQGTWIFHSDKFTMHSSECSRSRVAAALTASVNSACNPRIKRVSRLSMSVVALMQICRRFSGDRPQFISHPCIGIVLTSCMHSLFFLGFHVVPIHRSHWWRLEGKMNLVLILDLRLLLKRAQTENSNQNEQQDAWQSVRSPTEKSGHPVNRRTTAYILGLSKPDKSIEAGS